MNSCQKEFISILNKFINNDTFQFNKAVDYNDIYKLSKEQNLSGVMYLAVKDFSDKLEPQLFGAYKKLFSSTVYISALYENAQALITRALNAANIDHIYIKGAELRNYYPFKELRTMGDIDFIIREKDRQRTHDILIEAGYILDEKETTKYVWNYAKGNVNLEVHTAINYHKLFFDVDYTQEFSDCFSHIRLIDKNMYYFEQTYDLIFLIVHMAKHFYEAGLGVRQLLDIPVFIKKFNDSINWDHFWTRIEELKLTKFTENMLELCLRWFNFSNLNNEETGFGKNGSVCSLSEAEFDLLEQYILKSGVFGQLDKNLESLVLYKKSTGITGFRGSLEKLYSILIWIFPSYQKMTEVYSWFDGKSILWLPWGWVYRIYCSIFKTGETTKNKISGVISGSQEAASHFNMLEMVGLYETKKGLRK